MIVLCTARCKSWIKRVFSLLIWSRITVVFLYNETVMLQNPLLSLVLNIFWIQFFSWVECIWYIYMCVMFHFKLLVCLSVNLLSQCWCSCWNSIFYRVNLIIFVLKVKVFRDRIFKDSIHIFHYQAVFKTTTRILFYKKTIYNIKLNL